MLGKAYALHSIMQAAMALNTCIQKIKEALLQDNTKADLLEDLIDLLYEMCVN